MQRILVLGGGRSASFLIDRLLDDAATEDWFVTVGDVDPAPARERIAGRTRADAIRFDVRDAALRSSQIEQCDVVVNMLPAKYQDLVAWDCVAHGTHMVSVSYRDQTVRDLDMDAKRQGALLLTEMGLDPGIDHMSAIELIRRVGGEGGRVVGFRSYGSGIPAPGQPHNPLGYVLTWDPRNVVMAGAAGAQYMEDGRIRIVPHHRVFDHTWAVDVPGVGTLEAYANRDSMSYIPALGLEGVRTMIRGTLRYPGWSETWSRVVGLGLTNETLRIPDLRERTYREVLEMFVPASGGPLEQRVARSVNINPTGRVMETLRWLGLFDDEPIGCEGDTPAAMLIHLVQRRLPLTPDTRDMVVLIHELDVEYDGDRPPDTWRSSLIVEGTAGGTTAMALTVGLPVAIAVRLLLRGELPITGAVIPTHPAIVEPVLRAIEDEGLRFREERRPRDE